MIRIIINSIDCFKLYVVTIIVLFISDHPDMNSNWKKKNFLSSPDTSKQQESFHTILTQLDEVKNIVYVK